MRISFVVIFFMCLVSHGFANGLTDDKLQKAKRSYDEIAKLSGGVLFDVDKSEKGVTELMINLSSKRNEQRLYYVENEQNPTFTFNTNSQSELTHVVVNSKRNIKKVIITSPSGSIDEYKLSVDQPSIYAGSMDKPIPGLWKVEVQLKDQSKGYKAVVESSTNLYVYPSIYDNDLVEYEDKLTIGQEYIIKAGFIPDVFGATINVTCLNERRVSLCGTIQLDKNYMGRLRCPDKNFFINFDGILEDGTRFQKWVNEMKQAVKEMVIISAGIPVTKSTKSALSTSKGQSHAASNSSSGQHGQIILSFATLILLIIIH